MLVKPTNRNVLIAPCESPEAEQLIAIPEGWPEGKEPYFMYGVVLAVDERPYPVQPGMEQPARPCEAGQCVYYKSPQQETITTDGGERRVLVNENFILSVIDDVKPVLIVAKMRRVTGLVSRTGGQLVTL